MYMEDAVNATIQLMQAKPEDIKIRNSYNLAAMDFTPKEVAKAIKQYIPNFKITHKSDFRQEIADKWPKSINDDQAREDWNWKPKYDIKSMTVLMLEKLEEKYNTSTLK